MRWAKMKEERTRKEYDMYSIFCKHNWVLVSEITTKSKFEIAIETMAPLGTDFKKINLPRQMSDTSRKFIQIIKCEKCGKFKRFVEDI